MSVHRADCTNLKDLVGDDAGRWIEVSWAGAEQDGYRASVRIVCVDKMGMMAELSRILSNMNVSIIGVQGRVIRRGAFGIDFEVAIKDINQLEKIIQQFRKVPEVIEVFRGTM